MNIQYGNLHYINVKNPEIHCSCNYCTYVFKRQCFFHGVRQGYILSPTLFAATYDAAPSLDQAT